MAEILHHLGCIKPYKKWDKLPINWLAGFQPSTVPPPKFNGWNLSGQIITTSAEVTLNGGLVGESPQNPP